MVSGSTSRGTAPARLGSRQARLPDWRTGELLQLVTVRRVAGGGPGDQVHGLRGTELAGPRVALGRLEPELVTGHLGSVSGARPALG